MTMSIRREKVCQHLTAVGVGASVGHGQNACTETIQKRKSKRCETDSKERTGTGVLVDEVLRISRNKKDMLVKS